MANDLDPNSYGGPEALIRSFVASLNALAVSLATTFFGEDSTNNLLGVMLKPIAAATYALSFGNNTPSSRVTKKNLKAAAGNVFSVNVTNDNAAVRYFQIHNKASAPAGADVEVMSFKIPAGTATAPGVLNLGKDFFGEAGLALSTGVSFAISTTLDTFTDSATATEHIVNMSYV